MTVLLLAAMLVVILVGAELFTNSLEHLGEKLKISEGVTGSLFAAVGTALPEAIVPVVAIFSGMASQKVAEEVGVGAILGAPMMLSTLTLFLMALMAAYRRGWSGEFTPERTGLNRDLAWFLAAFGLGAIAIFIPHEQRLWRGVIAATLVLIYICYIVMTLRASTKLVEEGHATQADHPLYLSRIGFPCNGFSIGVQLLLGLSLIILGAHGFVHGIESLSSAIGVSALVLSLLIIPVATELPEKINSILWISRGRDTLAFGNITGAMVFQGSLLPAIGIMLTPWEARPEVLLGLGLTLLATTCLFLLAKRGRLRPYHLIFNGICYFTYFVTLTF